MFYRTIIGDKPQTIFLIVFFALIIWLPEFITPERVFYLNTGGSMPLHQVLQDIIGDNPLTSVGTAFLIVLFQCFLLVRLNAKYILIHKRTYFPALAYILLSGYLPELHQLSGALIASTFIILTLDMLMRSYKAEANSYDFFMAGLMLGIGSLFYAPMVYFIIFVWISTSLLRPFYWREYVFPILGILTPHLFFTGWIILSEGNIDSYLNLLKSNLFGGYPVLKMDLMYTIFASYNFLIILISSIYIFNVIQFKKIYVRKYFVMMFGLFITAIIIFAVLSGFNTQLSFIISIPVSYLFTNYFINVRGSLRNKIILYLLFAGGLFLAATRIVNLG